MNRSLDEQFVSQASPRVLFVDDDSAAREGFTSYLVNSGYDVMPAATGQQALTLASTWTPEVIVLDLGLPDIDGWEVARQLKAAPQTTAIPIIALTGSDLPHERVSAMRAGCDRHLAKPCLPADLVDAIRRCIGEIM
jgi:CheY-like chemotaxis protein